MKRIRTVIERHGQKYVDEPVYELISKARPLALSINHAFEKSPLLIRPFIQELSHYERSQLNWVKPRG